MNIVLLDEVLKETRSYSKDVLLKLRRMQETYLNSNSNRYSDSQIVEIKKSFEAVDYKFFLVSFNLEELWALSMDSRKKLVGARANSLEKLKWDNAQSVLNYVFLESFLFQAMAFVYIYMRYICLLMDIKKPGDMTIRKFYEKMERSKDPFQTRALKIKKYFETQAFDSNQWGDLLRSLRVRITHRDCLWPTEGKGSELLLGKVLLDWPTVQGKTYDRLCQDIQNGIFEMLRETSPELFELEWKSGPYKPDLLN